MAFSISRPQDRLGVKVGLSKCFLFYRTPTLCLVVKVIKRMGVDNFLLIYIISYWCVLSS